MCSAVSGSRALAGRVVLLASLLAACGEGCGGDGHGPADAAAVAPADVFADASTDASVDTGPLSVEDYLRALRGLDCEEVLRCESRYNHDWLYGLEKNCHPFYVSTHYRALIGAVAEGRVAFDPAAARTCVAGLAEFECLRGRATYVPACTGIFRGLVPPMGACSITSECVDGTMCTLASSCPGRCTAVPSRGGAGDACVDSFDCDFSFFCRDGTCTPGLGEGEVCASYEECEPNLICAPDAGGGRLCLDAFSVTSPGDPCIYAPALDSCPVDLVCICEGCTMTGTCVTTVPLGAPCDPSTPCGRWARCVSARCTALAPPDGDCSGGAVCPLTHWCNGATCRPLPVEGEPCSAEGCFQSLCLPEGTCGFTGGRVRSGELCNILWQDCLDGLECRNGDDGMTRCHPMC